MLLLLSLFALGGYLFAAIAIIYLSERVFYMPEPEIDSEEYVYTNRS